MINRHFQRLRFSSTDRAILKNIAIITPLSLIGRAGTLLIYGVLATWFGINQWMDFLYYHWGIAIFLSEVLSSASAYSVLIPMLAAERSKSHDDANACLKAIFSIYLVCMPIVCCVLAALSYFVSLFFLTQPNLTVKGVVGIVGGFGLLTMSTSIRWLFKAVLDAYQCFHLPAIMQGLRVPVVIGLIYVLKQPLGIYSIVWALIAGELLQVGILFGVCRFSLKMYGLFDVANLRHNWQTYTKIKQFLRKCALLMGAAVSAGLNPVVDRGMGTTLGGGAVSKLDYAFKLCAIPESVTGVIFPVLLSHWSALSADANVKLLRQSVWKGIIVTVACVGPLILAFYYFRATIVALVYGHGVIAETALHHVSSLFGIYLIGTLPRLVSRLLIRAHLALQNVKFVFSATLIRTIFNPFLNLIFMKFWGLDGIALSTVLLSVPVTAYIGIAFWIVSQRRG